ncbi:PREDICTED: echinoderm microtubule-associated protein-like 2 isoform X4 [Branchiostoma belcheri]|uniref:Echinoderm microtubule-associated protein-like 2 isoform X4 n=1 Tax=Branchiostoma belcheri TaxID=7741 RepID=A0A6P4YT03_BRABE|nr:PREDICTED: echinoderm microtubule-associated protein-like 2 isoform X4 [Branchiostoma belcheri]
MKETQHTAMSFLLHKKLKMLGLKDDSLSQDSIDLTDRVATLEQRVQLQEDEIQLLKSALADVLRRLGQYEEKDRKTNKPRPPVLPSRPTISNGGTNTPKKADHSISGRQQTPPTPTSYTHGISQRSPMPSPKTPHREIKRWSSGDMSSGQPRTRHDSAGSEHSTDSSAPRKPKASSGKPPLPPKNISKRSRSSSLDRTSILRQSGRRGSGSQSHSPREASHVQEEGAVRMFLRGRPITMYMPTNMMESYNFKEKGTLPAEKLKLDWVYGYRGRDCRSNLYLLPTGEIVYFVAAVVVLYNVDEQLQRHYLGHNDDVKCLAVHPDRITIATGQVTGHGRDGEAHVRVWDSVTLHTLHVIGAGDFERGVCCVAFSKSDGGAHLLAVDEANEHILSVWEWQKGEKGHKITETKAANEPVLAAEFHPTEKNLIVTCGKSHICFWTLDDAKLSKKQGVFEKHDKPKYVLCLAFAENGDAITGDSNGNIFVWGKGTNRISCSMVGAHDGGIFSLCVMKDGTLVSGGGKDRKLISWDRSYQQTGTESEIAEVTGPVRTITQGKGDDVFVGTTRNAILRGRVGEPFEPTVEAHTDELWGLAAHPNQHLFLTCAYDRRVFLWNADTHTPVWSKILEDPAQSAEFHPNGTVVGIGLQSGRWLVLDTSSKDLVTVHTDGNEQHDCVRYSPDGNFLAIGSHDNIIYLYSVTEEGRKYSRVGKLTGHSSFVTHLDWSSDSQYIRSNSGDYEILYWSAAMCRQVPAAASLRDVEWATATCTLNFQVFGMWPEGSDGTDINGSTCSKSGKLLANADDFGKVNLFNYPCSQPRSPAHSYPGHSSHVTTVDFLHDDSTLLSTGGKDNSIFQWKVVA